MSNMKTVALKNLLKRAEKSGAVRIDTAYNQIYKLVGSDYRFVGSYKLGSDYSNTAIDIARDFLASGERIATQYTHRYI